MVVGGPTSLPGHLSPHRARVRAVSSYLSLVSQSRRSGVGRFRGSGAHGHEVFCLRLPSRLKA